MPRSLITGKNKYGNKAIRNIPNVIYHPNGTIIKEWEVKNYGEKQIYDHLGKAIGKPESKVIYDNNGRPIKNKLITSFSKMELLREMVKARKKFRQGQKENMKIAGKTLAELMKLKGRDTTTAWKLITNDSFFRNGLLLGELKLEPNYRLSVIQTMCMDYYLDKLNEYKAEKEKMLKEASKKAQGVKQIILQNK